MELLLQKVTTPQINQYYKLRMYEHVIKWLANYGVYPSLKDMRLFMAHTRLRRFPKNTILMAQGKPVEHLYFVNSGVIRLLRNTTEGDTTLDFVPVHEFASTVFFIRSGQLSPCALESLTDVEALYWSKEDVLTLLAGAECGPAIEMAMLGRLLNWKQDREVDIITLTPEEQYKKLLRDLPEVVMQVPLKYIASYLGIHQDSLSRIRNKVSRKR
jgi:CRP-like cAMP-binding protein